MIRAQLPRLFLAASLVASFACSDDPVVETPLAPAPKIDAFGASKTNVARDEAFELTWKTANTTSIEIAIAGASGTLTTSDAAEGAYSVASITTDTAFVLTAIGAGGRASATIVVRLNAPGAATITSFVATPTSIDPGQSSMLSWSTSGASDVIISDSAGTMVYSGTDATGTQAVSPAATTSYTLTARGEDDRAVTASTLLTVRVPGGARVVSFSATPGAITLGASSDLAWEVERAPGGVTIEANGAGILSSSDLTGSIAVSPLADTQYRIIAINPAGDDTALADVTINASAPLIQAFSASPNPAGLGGRTTVSWRTYAADSVELTTGATVLYSGPTTNTNESTVIDVDQASVPLVLTARNATGATTSNLTITTGPLPQILSFAVDRVFITASSTVGITWTTNGAVTVSLEANGTPVAGAPTTPNGSHTLTVNATTEFVLIANNQYGAVAAVQYTVVPVAEAEPNNLPNQAEVLNASINAVTGDVYAGDLDYYAIDVVAGGFVYAAVIDGCLGSTFVQLIDTDGTTVRASGNCEVNPVASSTARNLSVGRYYVRVGQSVSFTHYTLVVQTGGPGCGNGVPERSESCDDGNTVEGDGCGATCAIEGQEILTGPGVNATFTSSITPAGDFDVFQIVMTAPGYITAQTFVPTTPDCENTSIGTAPPNNDTVLTLTDSNRNILAQNDQYALTNCSRIHYTQYPLAQVGAGTYYLFVDDYFGGEIDAYAVVIDTLAVACGNDIVEAPETCDDGNVGGGDGCSSTCVTEGVFETEPNNSFNATGVVSVATSTIVNGVVGSGDTADFYAIQVPAGGSLELTADLDPLAACPSANLTIYGLNGTTALLVDTGTVTADCLHADPRVGVSLRRLPAGTYYAALRAGPRVGYQLDIAVRAPACGNTIQDPNEQCDDGGLVAGDGCSATCSFETSASASLPSAVPIIVGGGVTTIGGYDAFQITITAETYLIAQSFVPSFNACLAGGPGFSADTFIRLYDSNGELVAFDDDVGGGVFCSLIEATRLLPGVYALTVRHYNDTDTVPAFDVRLTSAPIDICGNGVLEPALAEECDDGGIAVGDGCDASCQVEGNVLPESEPNGSQATANDTLLVGPGVATMSGATSPFGDDDVYLVTVPANTTLVLDARTYSTFGLPTSCDNLTTDTRLFVEEAGVEVTGPFEGELAFAEDIDGTTYCSELSVSLPAGATDTSYWVRVQGYDDDTITSYFLDLSLQ